MYFYQQNDEEMEKVLSDAGLDPKYWMEHFKNIGATTPANLSFLGPEHFDKLSEFAKERPPLEKKALKTFLEKASDNDDFRKKQLEQLEEKPKKLKEMIQSLKELQKEGKTRHDELVKDLESGVREALNISPKDWIAPSADLDSAIKKLESYETILSATLAQKNNLSQGKLIEHVSDGLMLHGISKLDGSPAESKVFLLKSHDSMSLRGPKKDAETKYMTFTSAHKEDSFIRNIHKFGIEGGLAGAGFGIGEGFAMAGEGSVRAGYKEESQQSDELHEKHDYFSTFKTCVVPMASFSFDNEDFILSQDALSKLHDIEELLFKKSFSDVEVRIACKEFFDKFGTCANRGPYTLGGIYWLKSFSEDFDHDKITEHKEFHSFLLNGFGALAGLGAVTGGGIVDGNVGYVSGSYDGKNAEDIQKKVKVTNGQLGGPPGITNLAQWKDGLIASNSTWKVIGQEMNAVYIWEILEMNYKRDFKDVQKLSQVLSRSLENNENWQKNESLLERVKVWNKSKDESKCSEHLSELIKAKKGGFGDCWCKLYLNQPHIQYYLQWVVEFAKSKQCSSSEAIHGKMQQILEYSDLVQVLHFPDQKLICEWLYPANEAVKLSIDPTCTDLTSFLAFLQMIIKSIHLNDIRQRKAQTSAMKLVETAVNGLLLNQESSLQEDHKLLLITLLLPLHYDRDKYYFRSELSIKHYEWLHKKINEAFQMKHEDKLHAQAYLFLQVLSFGKVFEVSPDVLNSHIQYLMDNTSNLEESIDVVLQQQSPEFNFCQLKTFLEGILENHQSTLSTSEDENDVYEEKSSSEEVSSTKEKIASSNFEKFLKKQNFLEHFPQGLTLQDALVIDRHNLASECSTHDPFQLLPIMLEKIKMSNHNSRQVLLYGKSNENKPVEITSESNENKPVEITSESNENKIVEITSESNENKIVEITSESNENKIVEIFVDYDPDDDMASQKDEVLVHPMDGLLALVHCSDNFLRQDLYVKLNDAQLAVPFLLPDPNGPSGKVTFPLWALRSIVKCWKCRVPRSVPHNDVSITSESHQERIVDCETPLISFIRFSHPGNISKSDIVNNIISSSNSIFFTYKCDGSSAKRKFVDGLVEATWYLPSGKENDAFNNVITFLNLRGNAAKHEQQCNFLLAHSYMSFVFINEKDINSEKLDSFKSTKGKVVFLLNSSSPSQSKKLITSVGPQCVVIGIQSKTPPDIVKSIKQKISNRLLQPQYRKQFLRISSIQHDGIFIDEDISPCQEGKTLALKIKKAVEGIPTSQVKDQMVPLQGSDLWRTWAKINKQHKRMKPEDMGNMGIEKFNHVKRKEKEDIRKNQLKKANELSPVMSCFIDVLLNKNATVRAYFLQWLKIYLDDWSRVVLPPLQQKCELSRNELRNKEISEKKKKETKRTLIKQDEDLINASFGVEHLFRELAQVYECTMEMKSEVDESKLKEVNQFPKIAAQLLLKGYPLEIVDGDAAHIPLLWVTAVVKSIKSHLNDSKMLVLSVLGIQSTGKSTLMNTMFGVRFAVSAGRCTRGAYFQLMRLKSDAAKCDEMKLKSDAAKCDEMKLKSDAAKCHEYMLIIDTEGLRAPELDSQHTQQHDNELATLVIGLADVSIINMFGEVPTEIRDILETVVHAIMRMKTVDLQCSCQFVRHHVSDVTASKTHEGGQRFQQALDEMTELAAKGQGLDKKYKLFSDVINFNYQTSIHNFPCLWEGDPPMAPVNPNYCQFAHSLKLKFVDMLNKSSDNLCSVENFQKRVTTLWNAILEENYVFSFKNILEAEAYTAVETEYGKWSWRLQKLMLDWQIKAEDTLSDDNEKELIEAFNEVSDSEFENIMQDVQTFFESSSLSSIMVDLRARYEEKLHAIKEDNKIKVLKICADLKEQLCAQKKLVELKSTARNDISKHLKVLFSELNIAKYREPTKEELNEVEKKFDQHWNKLMDDLNKRHPPLRKVNLVIQIENCILTECQLNKHTKVINRELRKLPLKDRGQPMQLNIKQTRHLNFGILKDITICCTEQDIQQAKNFTMMRISAVECYFNKTKDISYLTATSHVQGIIQEIAKEVDCYNQRFSFTNEYLVDLILEAAGYMLGVFKKQQMLAIENHPLTYLESLKSSFSISFKALCTASAHEQASAASLVGLVGGQIKLSLPKKLAVKLADDVRNKFTFASKQVLKGKVLLWLLEKRDFSAYKIYLTNVSRSYLQWIKEYIFENCNLKIVVLAESELSSVIDDVISAAQKSCTTMGQSSSSTEWLAEFQIHVKSVLPLNVEELYDLINFQENSDLKFFTDEFIKRITMYKTEYLTDFKKLESSTVVELVDKVAEIVVDNIAGCCSQCPFCTEQCDRTDRFHDVDHLCALHRPQCLGGYTEDNGDMVVSMCTELVNTWFQKFSNEDTDGKWVRYRNYREIYPRWEIPKEDGIIAPYWKWFIKEYKDDIATMFRMNKASSIPKDWLDLEPGDAENDVKKRYLK